MWYCTNPDCPELEVGKQGEPPDQWPNGLTCGWCWQPVTFRETSDA
jgi:hypothetical protein